MKRVYFLAAVMMSIFIVSCSSTQKASKVWVNTEKIAGKKFSKVFIVVIAADIEARTKLENDLAAIAAAKGYTVVKSMDIMPPTLSNAAAPTKEQIVSKVKASGSDAVFVASLLKKEEDVRYIPGTNAYSVRPYYSWHGNYYGYYSHWYPTISTPGYYTKDKYYFMQSNLYDANSEEIMWAVQSEIFNPSSLKKFSESYTESLIWQLEKAGLLKK